MAQPLPRPLRPGEFYCHQCGKFLPLSEHAQHTQEHVKLSQKTQN